MTSHATEHREDRHQSPATATNAHHVAHHISEFGEVENIVHLEEPRPSIDALPAPPVAHKDPLAAKERCTRLFRKCFHQRHLHQYWCHETLYRTAGNRSIGSDELFLDLVIVGGLASLGHELRENFNGWRDVEKFFILFAAVYASWRNMVFLWNLWGVSSDLTDKLIVYVVFTSLTAIALGAHGAFDDGNRPYVAAAAFIATAVPPVMHFVWSRREPLLRNPNELFGYLPLQACVNISASLPYFAACFVGTDVASRILFWLAAALNVMTIHGTRVLYSLLHRNRGDSITRMAVNIELLVEKYDVLTMIVLGESVLGLLFEAALVVTKSNARLSTLYACAAAATVMLFSLQTLYINVDGQIAKGGKHAIRYKTIHGIFWTLVHIPYHAALVLFATGLGLAVHDIALSASAEEAVERGFHLATRVARASDSDSVVLETVEAHFGGKEKWLFSVGWGASIMLSGLIGALHFAGPRGATKCYRFVARCVVVMAVMVGMPFTDVDIEHFIAVYTVVLIVIALVEFVFVQMDKLGFFTSEQNMFSSSTDELTAKFSSEFNDVDDDQDDEDSADSEPAMDAQQQQEHVERVTSAVAAKAGHEHIAEALRSRLCKSHRKCLVAASEAKSRKERGAVEHPPHA